MNMRGWPLVNTVKVSTAMVVETPVLRVALVEDDPRYRGTLEKFFTTLPEFALAGSFGSPAAALQAAEKAFSRGESSPWDLVLMDLELPGFSGLEATRRLKQKFPALPIIVLTVFEDPATVLEAISAGADGYLVKRISAPELRSQLRSILHEGSPLTPGVARTVLNFLRQFQANASSRHQEAPARLDLTEREQDVLKGLVRGMSYQQVADSLAISIETVRTHVRNIYSKLQVHSVAEAVSRAIRNRLV
jgi:DNA-binding NarL/FixJ family response regulator